MQLAEVSSGIVFAFKERYKVSSAGESHPCALSEPYLNVSAHTAPIIQPVQEAPVAASAQTVRALFARCDRASVPRVGDASEASCISSSPTKLVCD